MMWNRLRGFIVGLLYKEIDWANYNYIIETPEAITVVWDKRTTFEDGRFPWYYAKVKYHNMDNWITKEFQHELPKGGHLVYDPTKAEAREWIKTYEGDKGNTRLFYVKNICKPCQGESAISMSIRREKLLKGCGATVREYLADAQIWEVPEDAYSKCTQIKTAFGDR